MRQAASAVRLIASILTRDPVASIRTMPGGLIADNRDAKKDCGEYGMGSRFQTIRYFHRTSPLPFTTSPIRYTVSPSFVSRSATDSANAGLTIRQYPIPILNTRH